MKSIEESNDDIFIKKYNKAKKRSIWIAHISRILVLYFLVIAPLQFILTRESFLKSRLKYLILIDDQTLAQLKSEGVPSSVVDKLEPIKNRWLINEEKFDTFLNFEFLKDLLLFASNAHTLNEYNKENAFKKNLNEAIGSELAEKYASLILKHSSYNQAIGSEYKNFVIILITVFPVLELVLFVAFLMRIYRCLYRNDNFINLSQNNIPDIEIVLNTITSRMGISRDKLDVWLNSRNYGISPNIFEYRKRIHLVLPLGFLKVIENQIEVAQSILAHEFSHVLHKDTNLFIYFRTYIRAYIYVRLILMPIFLLFIAYLFMVNWVYPAMIWVTLNFIDNLLLMFIEIFFFKLIVYRSEKVADWGAVRFTHHSNLLEAVSGYKPTKRSVLKHFFSISPPIKWREKKLIDLLYLNPRHHFSSFDELQITNKQKSVQGWLLFYCFYYAAFLPIYNILKYYPNLYNSMFYDLKTDSIVENSFLFEFFAALIIVALQFLSIIKLWRIEKNAVSVAIRYLWITFILSILFPSFLLFVNPDLIIETSLLFVGILITAPGFIKFIVSYLYLARSERVKRTFNLKPNFTNIGKNVVYSSVIFCLLFILLSGYIFFSGFVTNQNRIIKQVELYSSNTSLFITVPEYWRILESTNEFTSAQIGSIIRGEYLEIFENHSMEVSYANLDSAYKRVVGYFNNLNLEMTVTKELDINGMKALQCEITGNSEEEIFRALLTLIEGKKSNYLIFVWIEIPIWRTSLYSSDQSSISAYIEYGIARSISRIVNPSETMNLFKEITNSFKESN